MRRHGADRAHDRVRRARRRTARRGWPTPGIGIAVGLARQLRRLAAVAPLRRSRRWTPSTTCVGEPLVDIADGPGCGLRDRARCEDWVDGPGARRRVDHAWAWSARRRECPAEPASVRRSLPRPRAVGVARWSGIEQARGRDPEHGAHTVVADATASPGRDRASATATSRCYALAGRAIAEADPGPIRDCRGPARPRCRRPSTPRRPDAACGRSTAAARQPPQHPGRDGRGGGREPAAPAAAAVQPAIARLTRQCVELQPDHAPDDAGRAGAPAGPTPVR